MPSISFGEFQNRSNMQFGLNKQRGKPEDRGLSNTCYGSIQYRIIMLKTQPQTFFKILTMLIVILVNHRWIQDT